MRRTPKRVAKVSIWKRRSPSTSGRSLVIAITVANTVTNVVMKLQQVPPPLSKSVFSAVKGLHDAVVGCSVILLFHGKDRGRN